MSALSIAPETVALGEVILRVGDPAEAPSGGDGAVEAEGSAPEVTRPEGI